MKEVVLPSDEIIVSKTNTDSLITYGNQLFIDISGYNEEELIGQPHNIIRHPDMPKGVFSLLWSTIQSEREFLGLVKNRCKNGDYYWAFANITPSYNAKQDVVGYYSVRRKPSAKLIDTLKPIYQEMLAIEKSFGADKEQGMIHSVAFLLGEIVDNGRDYDDALLELFNG